MDCVILGKDLDCSRLHLSPVYGGLTALPVDLWRQTTDAALSCQHCPAGAFGLFTSSHVGSGQRHIFTSRRSAAHCAGEFVETDTRDAALMLHSSRSDAALSSSSHITIKKYLSKCFSLMGLFSSHKNPPHCYFGFKSCCYYLQ